MQHNVKKEGKINKKYGSVRLRPVEWNMQDDVPKERKKNKSVANLAVVSD